MREEKRRRPSHAWESDWESFSFHFNGEDGLLMAHQAAEEVAHGLQQSVFLGQQVLSMRGFALIANPGTSVDPGAAHGPA